MNKLNEELEKTSRQITRDSAHRVITSLVVMALVLAIRKTEPEVPIQIVYLFLGVYLLSAANFAYSLCLTFVYGLLKYHRCKSFHVCNVYYASHAAMNNMLNVPLEDTEPHAGCFYVRGPYGQKYFVMWR